MPVLNCKKAKARLAWRKPYKYMHSGKRRSIAWQPQAVVREIGFACYSSCLKLRRQYLYAAKNNRKLPSYLRSQARKEYESVSDQIEGLSPFSNHPEIAQCPERLAKKFKLHVSLPRRIIKNYAVTGDFLFPGNKGYKPSPYEDSPQSSRKKERTRKTKACRSKLLQSSVSSCRSADNAEERLTSCRGSKHGAPAKSDFGERFLGPPDDEESLPYHRTYVEDSDFPSENYKAPYVSPSAPRGNRNSLCFLTPAGITIRLALSKYLCGSITWEEMSAKISSALEHAGIEQKTKLKEVADGNLDNYYRSLHATQARRDVQWLFRDEFSFSRFTRKKMIREMMDQDYHKYGLIERLERIRGAWEETEQALLDEYLPATRQ